MGDHPRCAGVRYVTTAGFLCGRWGFKPGSSCVPHPLYRLSRLPSRLPHPSSFKTRSYCVARGSQVSVKGLVYSKHSVDSLLTIPIE